MNNTLKSISKKTIALALTGFMVAANFSTVTEAKQSKPALSKSSVTLTEGKTAKLTVKKNGNTIKSTTFSSDKKAVATVSKKGVVTAKKAGKANVKAVVKVKSGKKYTLNCKVTVKAAKKPALSKTSVTLVEGKTTKLSVVKNGNDIKSTTFSSDNKKVATVDKKGVVKAVKKGNTQVKAQVTVKTGKKYTLTCKVKVNEAQKADIVPGGWTDAASPEITPEVSSIVETINSEREGVSYEPKALLATQVVNGINYLVLCKHTIIVPGLPSEYEIVSFNKDSSGKCSINESLKTNYQAYGDEPDEAGWRASETPVIEKDEGEIFAKAFESLTGVNYTPAAMVGIRDNIRGTEYFILAKKELVVPDSKPEYCFVIISSYYDGSVEVNDIIDIPVVTDPDTTEPAASSDNGAIISVNGVDVKQISIEMVGSTPNFFVTLANRNATETDFDFSKFRITRADGTELFTLLPTRTIQPGTEYVPYVKFTFTEISETLNAGEKVKVSYDGTDLGEYEVGVF